MKCNVVTTSKIDKVTKYVAKKLGEYSEENYEDLYSMSKKEYLDDITYQKSYYLEEAKEEILSKIAKYNPDE